ncbi:MAG: adenylate/guanylate cyclase domain-containing protein [Candidatus Limnocylindria bacterium]
MSELPSGTVTFLFTDIEGSTRLLQACGDRWPMLLRRHEELLIDAFTRHGGLVVGTQGDSFFVVFREAAGALAGAVDGQRALAGEAWPNDGRISVRMGMHTGDALPVNDTYVGLDVHRAARIMDAGHGGQILASSTTASLVRQSLPDGFELADLGQHRLKDLAAPEQLFAVQVQGLASEFPPLRTIDAAPNNLPTQLTSFVGRDREVREICDLLSDHRLVTLTGPGGTGKTRLSIQAAAEVVDRFPAGAFFVPLALIREVELVLPTIAQTVGLSDPGRDPLQRLAEHLAGKRLLVVLDNLEQVVDAAHDIAEVLRLVPEMHMIATSRSALRIYGEQEYPVAPLSLPDPKTLALDTTIAQFPAVALFVERARAVRPDFEITPENASAVAEICWRLEGLPLAIELAAARVRILSPSAMLSRLTSRLDLGVGGARDRSERQQTLRGAIAWSYDILDERERRFFTCFSVFAGGADLEDVEAVIGAEDAFDAIASLVDKSLVRQLDGGSAPARFRMLETIREYAHEQLVASGELENLRGRHASHFVELAEQLSAEVMSSRQKELLDRMEREHDNIRAAIATCLEHGDSDLALRVLPACWRFWQMRGYLVEGSERARRILALPGIDANSLARARAEEAAGGIAYWRGDFEAARSHYSEALRIHRGREDESEVANALYNRVMSYVVQSEDGGVPNIRPEADLDSEEALEIYRRLGDRSGEGRVLWAMLDNRILTRRADDEEVADLGRRCIEIFTATDDRFMLAWTNYMLGIDENLRHRPREALARNIEALGLFRETGDVSGYALVLDGFAVTAFIAGDVPRSLRLAGAANAIQAQGGATLGRLNREWSNFYPEQLTADPDLAAAFEEGKRMPIEDAIELALEPYRLKDVPAG